MFTAAHILFIVIHLALGLVVLRQYQQSRSTYTLIALANIFGLVYDNFAIAAGSFLPAGDLLKALNAPRFYCHALITPMIIIYAFGGARRVGLGWAQGPVAHTVFCVVTTALMGLGAFNDILRLQLTPESFQDVLRYVNSAVKGPPIPAIVAIVVLVGVGLLIWRKAGWPWLAIGGGVMFVAAAVGARMVTLGNFGEVMMMAALAATELKGWGSTATATQTPNLTPTV